MVDTLCFIFTHISRTFHQRVIFQAVTTKPSPKTGNLCKISSVGPSKSSTSSCSDLLPPSSASSSRRPSGSKVHSPALISNSSDEQSTKPCSPTSLPPRPSISSLGCKVLSPFQPNSKAITLIMKPTLDKSLFQVTIPQSLSPLPRPPTSPAASLKSSQSHGRNSNQTQLKSQNHHRLKNLISSFTSKSPPGHLCSQQQTGGIRRSQSTSQVPPLFSCLLQDSHKKEPQFKTWNYSWMKQASQVETEKPVKLQEPLVPKTVQVNT